MDVTVMSGAEGQTVPELVSAALGAHQDVMSVQRSFAVEEDLEHAAMPQVAFEDRITPRTTTPGPFRITSTTKLRAPHNGRRLHRGACSVWSRPHSGQVIGSSRPRLCWSSVFAASRPSWS